MEKDHRVICITLFLLETALYSPITVTQTSLANQFSFSRLGKVSDGMIQQEIESEEPDDIIQQVPATKVPMEPEAQVITLCMSVFSVLAAHM